MKGIVHSFDNQVARWFGRLPRDWRPLVLVVTLLGQGPLTVAIVVAIMGYEWALGSYTIVIAGFIALITMLVNTILKFTIRRRRPLTDYVRNRMFKTLSFPSGHAACTVVSYGLLATVLTLAFAQFVVLIWAVAVVIFFIIGVSRIYLGAHYPSDVVGGWVVGGLGLFAIIMMSCQV